MEEVQAGEHSGRKERRGGGRGGRWRGRTKVDGGMEAEQARERRLDAVPGRLGSLVGSLPELQIVTLRLTTRIIAVEML